MYLQPNKRYLFRKKFRQSSFLQDLYEKCPFRYSPAQNTRIFADNMANTCTQAF